MTKQFTAASGETVAGIRLERPLGQGSLGETWLAFDPDYQAHFIIKIADTTAYLEHLQENPAILLPPQADLRLVRPERAGISKGVAYLQFEQVAERSLGDKLRHGIVPEPAECHRIIDALLEALSESSTEGTPALHGDLKPENLFWDKGQLRLADYGQAELVRQADPEAFQLFMFGRVLSRGLVLPFRYHSPDRRQGGSPTVASELYSVGACLLHLVQGRLEGELPGSDDLPASLRDYLTELSEGTYQSYQAARHALAKIWDEELERELAEWRPKELRSHPAEAAPARPREGVVTVRGLDELVGGSDDDEQVAEVELALEPHQLDPVPEELDAVQDPPAVSAEPGSSGLELLDEEDDLWELAEAPPEGEVLPLDDEVVDGVIEELSDEWEAVDQDPEALEEEGVVDPDEQAAAPEQIFADPPETEPAGRPEVDPTAETGDIELSDSVTAKVEPADPARPTIVPARRARSESGDREPIVEPEDHSSPETQPLAMDVEDLDMDELWQPEDHPEESARAEAEAQPGGESELDALRLSDPDPDGSYRGGRDDLDEDSSEEFAGLMAALAESSHEEIMVADAPVDDETEPMPTYRPPGSVEEEPLNLSGTDELAEPPREVEEEADLDDLRLDYDEPDLPAIEDEEDPDYTEGLELEVPEDLDLPDEDPVEASDELPDLRDLMHDDSDDELPDLGAFFEPPPSPASPREPEPAPPEPKQPTRRTPAGRPTVTGGARTGISSWLDELEHIEASAEELQSVSDDEPANPDDRPEAAADAPPARSQRGRRSSGRLREEERPARSRRGRRGSGRHRKKDAHSREEPSEPGRPRRGRRTRPQEASKPPTPDPEAVDPLDLLDDEEESTDEAADFVLKADSGVIKADEESAGSLFQDSDDVPLFEDSDATEAADTGGLHDDEPEPTLIESDLDVNISSSELEALDPLEALRLLEAEAEGKQVRRDRSGRLTAKPKKRAPSDDDDGTECSVIISGLGISKKRQQAAELIAEITGVAPDKAERMVRKPVVTVVRGVSKNRADEIYKQFRLAGITARVTTRRARRK